MKTVAAGFIKFNNFPEGITRARIKQYLFVTFLITIIRGDLVNEARAATFLEDFSPYQLGTCFADQSTLGEWYMVFHGFGCTKIENTTNPRLHQAPAVSQIPDETHASLVIGPSFSGPISYRGKLLTAKQLRVSSSPNPWEVAWVIWNYQDEEHFYYFIPKPNGWELGKRDPAYPGGQRFLATGSTPSFPTKKWYSFQVTQDAKNAISVHVNGLLITKYTDREFPYTAGNVGLYNEDAHVHFDDISVTQGGDLLSHR